MTDLIKSVSDYKVSLLHDWKKSEKNKPLNMSDLKNDEKSDFSSYVQFVEDTHTRILSDLGSVEENSKILKSSINDLEKELALQSDSHKIKEYSLGNELEALNKQILHMTESSQLGEAKSIRMLEDTVEKLKKDHAIEIEKLQDSHQRAVKELNEIHTKTEKSLQAKLQMLTGVEKDKIEYESQTQKIGRVAQQLKDKIRPLYNIVSESSESKQLDEAYMIDIITKDVSRMKGELKANEEKIIALSKDNERLKMDSNTLSGENSTTKRTLQDIREEFQSTNFIMQRFRDAYNELNTEIGALDMQQDSLVKSGKSAK
jgi:hypothetical protein